jgi:hypothetical protein
MNTLYYYHLGKFIATRSSIISQNYKDFFFLKYIIHLNDYYLPKKKKKFKYHFSPQPMAFVSNWSLTFQLCQISPQPFNLVSKRSLPLSVR